VRQNALRSTPQQPKTQEEGDKQTKTGSVRCAGGFFSRDACMFSTAARNSVRAFAFLAFGCRVASLSTPPAASPPPRPRPRPCPPGGAWDGRAGRGRARPPRGSPRTGPPLTRPRPARTCDVFNARRPWGTSWSKGLSHACCDWRCVKRIRRGARGFVTGQSCIYNSKCQTGRT